ETVEISEPIDASVDALRRLRAAVAKVPLEEDAPEVEEKPAAEVQGRFAINNLINRMTGHGPNTDVAAVRRQPPLHEQEVQTYEDINEEEVDRVEIPAFLRRQAN
ncbi:MAG: cell division protein FtsZ, partial [Alphaproteobacteria bacterium]